MSSKRCLITGGSSGIGRACVRTFAKAGYEVCFTYRSGKSAAESLINELSPNVHAFAFDQGNWDSHQALLESLPGAIDILINNAALGSATVEKYTPSSHLQDQALMQVNATGTLWLTQALAPGMIKRGYGKIVFMSSVGGGISPYPGFRLADGMSKAAIAFLTKQLAAELANKAVDVFAICPGATDTAMFQASTLSKLTDVERTRFTASLPKGRLIEPQEIAELALFLCSDAGRILHGAVLDASLGLGVHPGSITGGYQ